MIISKIEVYHFEFCTENRTKCGLKQARLLDISIHPQIYCLVASVHVRASAPSGAKQRRQSRHPLAVTRTIYNNCTCVGKLFKRAFASLTHRKYQQTPPSFPQLLGSFYDKEMLSAVSS